MIFLGKVLTYLSANQLFLLALCLGLGVLLGKVKMGKFPMNATLGTLFVAFTINLLFHVGYNEVTAAFSASEMKELGIKMVADLSYPDMLSSLFFALFSFALGYSAGPDFWETLRKNGLKQIGIHALMVVFYCACAVGVTMGTCSLLGITHLGNVNGLMAGAQTQSSILGLLKTGEDSAQKQLIQGNQMVIFGLTYVIGVLLMSLFAQFIAPRLLGTTLPSAVKKYIDAATEKKQFSGPADSVIPTKAIQQRAYRVMPGSPAIGKTVEEFETAGKRRFEVITIHRGSDYLEEDLFQSTKIKQDDVLVIVGDARAIFNVRDKYLEETVDNKYLSTELQSAEIVITEKEEELEKDKRDIRLAITNRGVLLQDVQRKGRRLAPGDADKLEAGDILHVTGLKREIDALAKDYGYIKDNGAPSSIPAVALALAAAVLLGSISLFGLSIGTSCCITLLGMACGIINQRSPRVAHVPAPALSFIRTLGLNLFIASKTLNSALDPQKLFNTEMLMVLIAALVIAVLPALISLFFGKRVLKMDPVTLLGSLCGSATCTPALTALEDATGSTVFTSGYTPAYVISNVLLTVAGIVVMALM